MLSAVTGRPWPPLGCVRWILPLTHLPQLQLALVSRVPSVLTAVRRLLPRSAASFFTAVQELRHPLQLKQEVCDAVGAANAGYSQVSMLFLAFDKVAHVRRLSTLHRAVAWTMFNDIRGAFADTVWCCGVSPGWGTGQSASDDKNAGTPLGDGLACAIVPAPGSTTDPSSHPLSHDIDLLMMWLRWVLFNVAAEDAAARGDPLPDVSQTLALSTLYVDAGQRLNGSPSIASDAIVSAWVAKVRWWMVPYVRTQPGC